MGGRFGLPIFLYTYFYESCSRSALPVYILLTDNHIFLEVVSNCLGVDSYHIVSHNIDRESPLSDLIEILVSHQRLIIVIHTIPQLSQIKYQASR
jgi:hypothetical protein